MFLHPGRQLADVVMAQHDERGLKVVCQPAQPRQITDLAGELASDSVKCELRCAGRRECLIQRRIATEVHGDGSGHTRFELSVVAVLLRIHDRYSGRSGSGSAGRQPCRQPLRQQTRKFCHQLGFVNDGNLLERKGIRCALRLVQRSHDDEVAAGELWV